MSATDEAAIRALIERRIEAIHEKNATGAVAVLAADVVAFEMVPPLALPPGAARDSTAMQAWLDSFDGAPAVELRDLTIHVSGDAAFCHSLNRLSGTRTGGTQIDMWMRSTLGFRKRGDEWAIVHAHTSVPFRVDGSFRAALELEP